MQNVQVKKKHWYVSKTFWGALLLAIALWCYASLSEEYQVMIEVPLTVEAPKDRASETVIPKEISIDVTGTGWYLFNHLYFNNIKRCHIKLDNVASQDSIYTITSVDMQKGLQNLGKISYQRFFPDVITIKTDKLFEKEVPVFPHIKAYPAEGFALVGNVKVIPPTIFIKGNENIIKTINKWTTENLVFKDVSSSFTKQVFLSDTLQSILQLSENVVDVSILVQPYSEITLDDIPLQVIGAPQIMKNIIVQPKYFSVTLRGGIDVISKISNADVGITINYQDIINDSTGIIKPNITIPPYTSILNTSPKYVFHSEIVRKFF